MKYRSRLDIVANILTVAGTGTIKTDIMYNCSLSFPQLKEYLDELTTVGALEFHNNFRTFTTTRKGKQILRRYWEINEMLPSMTV